MFGTENQRCDARDRERRPQAHHPHEGEHREQRHVGLSLRAARSAILPCVRMINQVAPRRT